MSDIIDLNQRKLVSLDDKLRQVQADIGHLKRSHDDLSREIKHGFKAVDARFDIMNARFDTMEARMETVLAEMRRFFARYEQVGDV